MLLITILILSYPFRETDLLAFDLYSRLHAICN